MVAAISGSGLGLYNTSATNLNGQGTEGNAALGPTGEQVYVNTATGNLVLQDDDQVLTAEGLDVSIVRTYNSQGQFNGGVGENWRLNVDESLAGLTGTVNTAGSTITKTFGDGSTVTYTYNATLGVYTSSAGPSADDTLSYNATTQHWTWTDSSSRTVEVYNSSGQLLSSSDSSGNMVTYGYTGSLLTTITDASGQVTTFTYSGGNITQISTVSDGVTQTLVYYSYDSQGRLSTVTTSLTPQDNSESEGGTYVTTYTYQGTTDLVSSITQSDGTSISFTYEMIDGEYYVASYTDGLGHTSNITYSQGGGTGTGSVNWGSASTLASSSAADSNPQIAFDSAGNGLAVWISGDDLVAKTYSAATQTWSSTATVVVAASYAIDTPSLSMDPNTGNAVLGWVQSNGTVNTAYAINYNGTTNTWGSSPVQLESSSEAVDASGKLVTAISGNNEVVGWMQLDSTGTDYLLNVALWNGSTWSSPTQLATLSNGHGTYAPSLAMDSAGDITALWTQSNGTTTSTYVDRYTAGGSWSGPALLAQGTTSAETATPLVGFGSSGNGLAIWQQGSELMSSTYTKSTNTWSAAAVLFNPGSGTSTYAPPALSVAANGDAVLAWTQGNSTIGFTRYAALFSAAAGTWGTPQALGSFPSFASGNTVTAAINSSSPETAIAGWVGFDSAGIAQLYVSVWDAASGQWSTPTDVEASGNPDNGASQPAAAISASGKASIVWRQWWQANTAIYINSASYVASSTVTENANPEVLTLTSPAYYVVQPNDTWATIALAVYGTSDPNAATALQSALSSPTLTTGAELAVPATLTYTPSVSSYSTQTEITDALGNTTTMVNDSSGRLVEVESPAVNGESPETQFTYGTNGKLAQVTQYDNGNASSTVYQYDSNGNVLLTRDADGDTVTNTYDADDQLLTQTTYSVADPNGSSPLNTASAMTTWNVYDADERLCFTISPAGDVTEYVYASNGNRTSQIIFTGAQYNVSGLSTSSPPTLAQMQTWASAQNLAETDRTDYTYDFRGNLSTSTVYSATSSTGAGVASTASTTQYVYNQYGQLLQVIDPRGSANTANGSNSSLPYATTYTYDGLGRVLSKTQWVASGVSDTTLYQYDDAQNTITTTAANGLVTTSVYNADDELVSQSESSSGTSLGTTIYTYDADGRLRTVTNPDGIETHALYDADGRKVATVDGDGDLTQYVYNAAGQVVETIGYAGTVNTASLADVNGVPANVSLSTLISEADTDPAANEITRSVYDAAGRLVYSIDDAGDVTENIYDGAGRLTDVIAYATPVSIPASTGELTPSQVPVVTSANDRNSRNFYDADGNLVGTLDAAGYLTQYQYNAANQLVQSTQYATATTSSLRASGTLAQLIPASDPGSDIVNYYFYDSEGRQVGEIDGDSYLTQTEYDAASNVAETIRYSVPVTYTAGATLASLIPTTGTNETTQYQYNGNNQLVQETNYQGTVTQYQYDAVGDLISTTAAAGTADVRTAQTQYNALGEVTAQLTGVGSSLITSGMTQAQINAIWAQYGVSYGYDAAGLRTSMTDENGNKTYYYYDNDGRLQYTVNGAGDVTETKYDAFGRVTDQIAYDTTISTSGLTGGLTSSTNIASLVAAIANSAIDSSTATTYGYDASGRTETTTTATGASTTEQFDAFGDVTSKTQAISSTQSVTTDYDYDQRGLLLETISDPTGLDIIQSNQYDAFGRLVQSTDGNGNITKYAYDPLGQQIQTTDALGGTTSTTYDAFGRVLSTTDALGNKTTYSYNNTARSMTVTNPDGVSVTTVFNEFGQQLKVTDGNGNVTNYAYDANGDLLNTTDALGTESSATYDGAGLVLTSTDADGIVTSYTYDAANRLLTKTLDPTGLALTTKYGYDAEGRVVSTTNTSGVVTTTAYDRDGRVTQVIVDPYNATTNPNGLNLETTYTYDDLGDVLTETQGVGSSDPRVTQYTYDKLGRRTEQVVDPGTGTNPATGQAYLNLKTQYFYDADGNLTQTINADGDSTWYVYDADDQLHYTINALGGVTETDYDADGRLSATRQYATAITVPASTQHVVTESQVTLVTSSADRLTRNYYDAAGQEVYSIDGAGTVTQRTYDGDGNVIQLRVINGVELTGTYATTAAVTTALGSAATTLGSGDRVQWTVYDARARAIFTIDALGNVTQTQYDGDGNAVSTTQYATPVTPPSSLVTSLKASGQTITVNGTTTITVASNASSDRTTRYWYDTAGRQVYMLSASGYLTRTQYNDAARTQTVTVYANPPTIPAGAATSNLENGTGGVVITPSSGTTLSTGQVVEADQTTTTYYDTAGRVSKITNALGASESYTYDALGDDTSFTNDAGETWTYKYDVDGRMIEEDTPDVSVTNMTGSGTSLTPSTVTAAIVTLMTYDAMGNVLTLTQGIERLTNGTENTSNASVTTYGYDALGRQVTVTLPAVPVYNGISTDNVAASGSSVGSDSTTESPTTQVVYDTLGDEIASRDAGGNWTYKIYDQLGRVVYEIDALNYVTGYTYDQFGNQLTTTRYATATSGSITGSTLTGLQVTSTSGSGATITATNGSSTSTVQVATTSGQDRTITSTYDQDNHVKSVSEPAVFTYVPNVDEAGGQAFTASPTTYYDYNAFGQVVRTASLLNTDGNSITNPDTNPSANTWSYSYTYYNRAGNKSAAINADGYLTTYQYDAEGNLTQQYQYATAATGASISGYTAPATSSTDRETQYQYDRLNRQVTQTLVGVQYTQVNDSGGAPSTVTSESGNAVTYYGYDALGNQTSVTENGATTYTYYDALGRVIATIGPASQQGDSGASTITPLTLMQRDVYGNLVVQTQYAAGLTTAIPTSGPPTTANTTPNSSEDRTTYYLRDADGQALETEQLVSSGNVIVYDAYDALGNLVKQYQPADGSDTLVTFYVYDALGRQTDVISPEVLTGTASTDEISDQYTRYDAFGEVTAKGTGSYNPSLTYAQNNSAKVYQESSYYDQAGRVYLTNSTNGAYTAYIYDLAGNATGTLQDEWSSSSDNYNLSGLSSQGSAEAAYSAYTGNTGGLMFTQTRYDAMGNVVEQRLPTYSSPNPEEEINNGTVQVQSIGGVEYLTWDEPADSTLTPTLYIDGTEKSSSSIVTISGAGTEYGYVAGFALTGVAIGTHTYSIEYTRPAPDNTSPAGVATGTFSVNASLAITSTSPGTVNSVTANLSGSTLAVSWTPDNTSVTPTFSILVGSTWQNYSGSVSESGVVTVDLTAPAAGTYQYRITDTLNGETEAQGTGTVTITAATTKATLTNSALPIGTVNSVSQSTTGTTVNVYWSPDSGVTSASFAILVGTTWTTYTGSLTESGLYIVSFTMPAAGTYQYRITDLVSGVTEAQGTGNITFTSSHTASIGTPTQLESVSGYEDLGNDIFGWTTAENTGNTVVFHYKANGASSWAGTLPVTISGGVYSVNMSSLSGNIAYEIDYTASGAAQPYRVGRGIVTVGTTTIPASASISTPTQLLAVSGFENLGNGIFGWTTAENTGDTVTFHYKAAGASSWAGTLAVTASDGVYSVNLSGLSGTIDFEVDYTASGAAQPYRASTGTVAISPVFGGATDTTSLPATAAAPYELQTVDRWGNVTSSTNTAEETTYYDYNEYNDLIETIDPEVAIVSVKVASNGQTGAVSSTSGTPTSFDYYNLYGRLIATQDGDGNLDQKNYNSANQVISELDADGGETTYDYDAFGDQTQATTSVNSTTKYSTRSAYDQAGRLIDTEQELAMGTLAGSAGLATGFASSVLPRSNANVILTTYQYDQAGRRIDTTNGAGNTTGTTYDLHGNVTSTTTALGATTSYGYDVENQQTSETDPDGNTQSWTYNYFDDLLSQVDMSGTHYTYTYDSGSGLLTSMTSTGGLFGGEDKTYSYDSANHLIEIDDTGVNSITYYAYDTAGRVERQVTIDGGEVAENTSTQYDAMGRISNISGLGYSISYSYDGAGNRTSIQASYSTATGKVSSQDLWYGYDQMNRVLISEGADDANTISINSGQGTILTYDWRGDRTSAITEVTNFSDENVTTTESGTTDTYGNSTGMAYYTYNYDGAGRLTTTYVEAWQGGLTPVPLEIDARVYDQASRMTQDTTQSVVSGTLYTDVQTNTYNADGTVASTLVTQNGVKASSVAYSFVNESGVTQSGYDAAGNLDEYVVTNYNSSGAATYTSTNTFAYEKGGTYLETSQTVTNAGTGAPENGSSAYTYNADQQLVQYADAQTPSDNRYFLNNANGQALTVVSGSYGNDTTTTYGSNSTADAAFTAALMSGTNFFQSDNAEYFFYNPQGSEVGTFGDLDNTLTANFDVNFTPISQQYPTAEPPQYVVQAGDTLATIAAQVYGDSSLWYVIAQANGLSSTGPNDSLSTGTSLILPNVVVPVPNSSESYKPFSISEALGNTTPTQPLPPAPPSGGGCGNFGELLAALVAAVVAAWVAPEIEPEVSSLFSSALGAGTVAADVATTAATAAIAGAAGNVAGQAVGIATGDQSSFNWDEVASSALTYALTDGADTGALGTVAQGAVNNVIGQGVDDALGLQHGFNWAQVAAAAVAAPIANAAANQVGGELSSELGTSDLDQEAENFVKQFTAGEVDSIVYTEFSGGKLNFAQITGDAFGNAIGNAIVGDLQPSTPAPTANSGTSGQSNFSSASQGNVDTADGGSTGTTTDPLTKNDNPLLAPVQLQDIQVDPNLLVQPSALSPLTFAVGGEGAQGMWGEAESQLAGEGVTNPTNAQIENMDQQLLSANPGVTTLQIRQELNFPDGSTTLQGIQTYNTLNQGYEESQLQPVDVSASLLAVPSQTAAAADASAESSGGPDTSQPPAGAGSGAPQSPDIVMQSIGYMAWAPMTPAQADGVARADEALLPVAVAAAIPGLGEIVPAAELTSGTGLAIIGSKTAIGFGLGYFGAKVTGTESTTGDVGAGLAGALALNLGGPAADFLTDNLPALGKFGNTALLSGVGGGLTEFAAQSGDALTGNGQIDLPKIGYVGLTTLVASATMGEGALATAVDYANLGPVGNAVTESIGATTTALGSFAASEIWNGTMGAPSSVLQGPANTSSDPAAGRPLIYPIWPNNSSLWAIYSK